MNFDPGRDVGPGRIDRLIRPPVHPPARPPTHAPTHPMRALIADASVNGLVVGVGKGKPSLRTRSRAKISGGGEDKPLAWEVRAGNTVFLSRAGSGHMGQLHFLARKNSSEPENTE